jgi:hypothetical protein
VARGFIRGNFAVDAVLEIDAEIGTVIYRTFAANTVVIYVKADLFLIFP